MYWKVDERTIKEAVKDMLPEFANARVFYVTRRNRKNLMDSSHHVVQQLTVKTGPGTPEEKLTAYNLCDCMGNKFFFPLVLLGVNGHNCSHIKAVKAVTKHV